MFETQPKKPARSNLQVFLGFLLGGYLGSKISLNLPEGTLKKIFAIVLLLIAGKVLFLDK